MTKDEINQFFTEKLFGECWHDRMVVTEWQGDHEAVICKCLKCARESDEVFANPNFFTPDGMMKVIDAMGEKYLAACVMRAYSHDEIQQHAALFTDGWRDGGKVYDDNLPEAVCRAAVEFLKEAKNDE